MSLKCDLNPVFRRKGALLWPPLHPSPHFHPPCLGRRTKALKRLSTSSLGPHLVGRSKSTSSPLQCLHLPLPHFPLSSSVLLLICPAAWAAPPPAAITPADTCLHQHPPHGEAKRLELCGFVKRQDLCLTAECLARELVPVMQHLLVFFNAFFLCSRSLSSRWPGEHLVVQSLVVIKQPPFENTGKHVIVKCLFLELLNSYFSFSTLSSSFHAVSNKCLAMRHSEPPTACSHFLQ